MEGSIAFEFSSIDYPRDRSRWTSCDRREWWVNAWWDADVQFLSFGFRVFGLGLAVTMEY